MMSSEERKEIVAYLYKLIKESPLFKDYTDDRIREAAVRAEHKAYTSSSTKDEYLRAMNSKAQRIKSTKTNEAPIERNSTGTYNSGYGQYSYPPMYQEPTYVNQTYERKEPTYANQRNQSSYANKSADLYQNGYQQGNFYNNREMPSRNQTLFNNVTIKDANKNYNNRMYNGREYERPINHVNNNLNNNYAFVNPQTSTDSFMYVNELNGHLKYDQNPNQPYSGGGYQVRTGYITERGFHSNQNLFENYPEPQYTKFQPAKKMSDFKPSVSNLKYRQRYEEPYQPQETFLRRGVPQNNGSFIRHPRTSPIGMAPHKKTERSFSIAGQAYPRQVEKNSVKRQDLRREEINIKDNTKFNELDKKIYENKPKKKLEIDELQANELFNSFGFLFEPQNDVNYDSPSNFFEVAPSKGSLSGKLEEEGVDIRKDSQGKKKRDTPKGQKKNLNGSEELPGNLQEKKSMESVFKLENVNNYANSANKLENGSIGKGNSAKSILSKKLESVTSKKFINNDYPSSNQSPINPPLNLSPPINIPSPNYSNVVDVGKIKKKSKKSPLTSPIPTHLKEFIDSKNLFVLDSSTQDLKALEASLSRCVETQTKAANIYAEHKKDFPNSRLHENYIHADSLINKQRESLPFNVFFLTWRCVDNLLDSLKRVYIDMKVQLDESRNSVLIYSDVINGAYNAFHSAKKRDPDFVLDLRDK